MTEPVMKATLEEALEHCRPYCVESATACLWGVCDALRERVTALEQEVIELRRYVNAKDSRLRAQLSVKLNNP